nr:hypothetical protein [Tanacetum cinerariifolium]
PTPSLIKKVFANIKKVGNGFSREVTSLFVNMLVQALEEVSILQANVQPIPIPTESSTSKPQKQHKPKRKHTKEPEVPLTESSAEHNLPLPSHDPLPCDLKSEVLDIKSTYKAKIEKLERKVERLEEENRVLKELKGVYFTVDSDEPVMEKEESSKQGRKIADINANVLSVLDVNDDEPAGVEEVLEVVKDVKLIPEVVTTARVDGNAANVQDTTITAAEATKVIIEVPKSRKRREDLKSLWKIVRERFEKTEPKNFSDDYLLNTLKIMFEKPNVEANVWKEQKGKYGLAKVKSWKLFNLCGVHCLTLSTTQIFLLVERMYPLTHFTLEKMVNDVRLEVDDESEMSLELLRLVKR